MKKSLLLLIAALFSLSTSGAFAQTETQLTAEQIETLNWVKGAHEKLQDAEIKTHEILSLAELKVFLVGTMKDAVIGSHVHQETLARYTLNRALGMITELESEAGIDSALILNQEIRILKRSLQIALHYCEIDQQSILGQSSQLPFALFGVEDADALLWINESEINASIQYRIATTVLGYMQVDLFKDNEGKPYAAAILRINKFLKKSNHVTDYVKAMQEVRKTYFGALDDLKATSTPVGERIRQAQLKGKTVRVDRRIRL